MWQTVTREQLYEQVWSVPLSKLCEAYGLSDNGCGSSGGIGIR